MTRQLNALRSCLVLVICTTVLTHAARAEETADKTRSHPETTVLLGKSVIELPLEVTEGGTFVSAGLNGAGPYRLLLDTGETLMRVDNDIAVRLNLGRTGSTEVHLKPGQAPQPAFWSRIDSVTFGEAEFRKVPVVILDFERHRPTERSYDATLPLSIFDDCLVTFDFPAGRLRIEAGSLPEPDGASIRTTKDHDGLTALSFPFGAQERDVVIDSDEPTHFVLPIALSERVALASPMVRRDPVGWRHIRVTDYFPLDGTIRLGTRDIVNPPIAFYGNQSTVGHPVIRHFAFTFDWKNHRVRITSNESKPITYPSPRLKFGVAFKRRRGGATRISEVEPGTYADKIHMAPNGFVRNFLGKPVEEYTDEEFINLLLTLDRISLSAVQGGGPLAILLEAGK